MDVSGQLYSRGNLPVSIGYEAVWAPELVWRKKEKSMEGFEIRPSNP
jgi:hypothetical protein